MVLRASFKSSFFLPLSFYSIGNHHQNQVQMLGKDKPCKQHLLMQN